MNYHRTTNYIHMTFATFVLCFTDAISTLYAIAYADAYEINPITFAILDAGGPVFFLLFKLGISGVCLHYIFIRRDYKLAQYGLKISLCSMFLVNLYHVYFWAVACGYY